MAKPLVLTRIPRGSHAVIEANAGTGKTNAIAHLFVELLLSTEIRFDQILVVTFTDKATLELRTRIQEVITEAKKNTAILPQQAAKLDEALHRINFSSICTIHSFCERLVDEFMVKSAPGANLEVVDGARAFHAAFRAVLREQLASGSELRPLAEEWFASRSVAELEKLLYSAHCHRYLDVHTSSEHTHALCELARLTEFSEILRDYASAQLESEAKARALKAIQELCEIVTRSNGSPTELVSLLAGFDFDAVLRPRTRNLGKSRFSAYFSEPTQNFLHLLAKAEVALQIEVRAIDAFLPLIAKRLETIKRRQGLLDYDDMLRWAWQLLDGPRRDEVLASLRARFVYALVDEFQDTDELQWCILRRIFVENTEKNFIYVIGDPKQAIYGFRHADVFTYLAARRELQRMGAPIVPLDQNFRSSAAMVDAINIILKQDTPAAIFQGEIRYDHPSVPTREGPIAARLTGEPMPPVTIMRCTNARPTGLKADQARRALAAHIAKTLGKLLFEPQHALATKDSANGEPIRVEPQDVLVLSRTNSEIDSLVPYLRKAGIPFVVHREDSALQSQEAEDVLAVLRAIDQPRDRSRRFKAYLTPFFEVQFSSLICEEDYELKTFFEQLLQWRALAERRRFAELFHRLLYDTGLVNRELFFYGKSNHLAVYEKIFSFLLEEAYSKRLNLRELVQRLEFYMSENPYLPPRQLNHPSISSSDNGVQVMTVHKSKGLQAKVVILFGGLYRNPQRNPIVRYHVEGKARLAVGAKAQELAKDYISQEDAEEDARLIYVAITRARAKLYLPFFPLNSLLKKPNGFYARLNARLVELIEKNEASPDLFEIENFEVEDAIANVDAIGGLDYALAFESLPTSHSQDETATSVEPRVVRATALETRSYSSMAQKAAPQRALESLLASRPEQVRPRDAVLELTSGPEMGTLIHRVLEKLDWSTVRNTPDFDEWKGLPHVREIFRRALALSHGLEEEALETAMRVVHTALRAPIALGDKTIADGLCALPCLRECAFLFPYHLGANDGTSAGTSGYFTGSIDLVFQYGGLTYFADWKTDVLASYDQASLAEHVERNYQLQFMVYLVALLKLLRIESPGQYDARFGGFLYLFVRGLCEPGQSGQGVYFYRPRWHEVQEYTSKLISSL